MEAIDEPLRTPERHVAAGGWRRAAIGFLVGLLAGAAVALVLPRDDGPRRRVLLVDEGTVPPGARP